MALLTISLGSCSIGGGQTVNDPAPDTAAYPVVAAGQARSVLDAVEGALVRGVDPKHPTVVDARLLGPFRDLAIAQARIALERKKRVPRPARVERLRLIVPADREWPRFFIAVGNSNQASTPVLRVLSSPAPRSPYGLWAEATMLPGATLPETAPSSNGSPLLPDNAGGLVASPAEALTGFAGYLNGGARTTVSKQYRRSIYSDQLEQQLSSDRVGLKGAGTVSSHHTVGASPALALRTTDGGALVVGELKQSYVITVKHGRKINVSDQNLAALANGKSQFSKSFTRTAVEVVVFKVPPRGKGLITVIAAQKGDVKAVAQ
jgi:hypothetical protein